MTDLLLSTDRELQLQYDMKTKFEHAFSVFKDIIQTILDLPKLSAEQYQYLDRILNNINNNRHLWDIFVKWDNKDVPTYIKQYTKSQLDDMDAIDFSKAVEMPDLKYSLVQKLIPLMKELQQKNTILQIQKTDDIQSNKYNQLLLQIINKQKEQTGENTLIKIILDDEKRDQEILKNQIGDSIEYLNIVDEFYKQRKMMLTKIFDFCNKLEQKLTQFISSFGGQKRTEEEVAVLKKNYESIKQTLSELLKIKISLDDIDVKDYTKPSYNISTFQENLKNIGIKIVNDYTKDDTFSTAIHIIKEVCKIPITQDEIMFELILPSIIFSQIQIIYTFNMKNEQIKPQVYELMQPFVSYDDIKADKKQLYNEMYKQQYEKVKIFIKKIYSSIVNDVVNTAIKNTTSNKTDVLTNVGDAIKEVGVDVTTADKIKQEIGDHINDTATTTLDIAKNGAIKIIDNNFIKKTLTKQVLNEFYTLFGNNDATKLTTTTDYKKIMEHIAQALQSLFNTTATKDITEKFQEYMNDNIPKIEHIDKLLNNMRSDNKYYTRLPRIDVQNMVEESRIQMFIDEVYSNQFGEDMQQTSLKLFNTTINDIDKKDRKQLILKEYEIKDKIDNLVNTKSFSADKGLILRFNNKNEDIIMKLTSQSIDAIYSTIMIQLQSIQTSPEEMSIAQIIGGASVPNSGIIQGAEMFYQLFAATTLITRKQFQDMQTGELNLKIQLPIESRFKDAFEFIIPRQTSMSPVEFTQYVSLLNNIWNQSSENISQDNENINKRTRVLLQEFMNDLMKGLTFAHGQMTQSNISQLNDIQVYQNIIKTTGFEQNFSNINSQQSVQEISSMFQLPKQTTSTTFNDRYQQLVSVLENMILNQQYELNFDDKQFSHYIKQYYSDSNYKELAREKYVYEQYNKFITDILNNKLSNAFTPTFLNDFGLLYYYYLMYVSNILNILADYHKNIVDNRLHNLYYFKEDGNGFDTTDQMKKYQDPLFLALYAATHDSTDPFFKSFYETIQVSTIEVDCYYTDAQLKGTAKRGTAKLTELDDKPIFINKTVKEKYQVLLRYYGNCQKISDTEISKRGGVLLEKLDSMWQQYQYIVNSKEKQVAYILNLIFSGNSTGGYTITERFINKLKKNNIFDNMFKQITEQTPKIGKIIITLYAHTGTAKIDAQNKIGNEIPAGDATTLAPDLDQWDGTKLARLVDNDIGVLGNISRKYYLNENYENILINYFYPDYIYPQTLEEHVKLQEKIVKQLPLVQYTDAGYNCDQLIKFLDETKGKIMEKFDKFFTENNTLKQYYRNQLEASIDISGFIKAIFVKKIIPPCSIQMFRQNYKLLQPFDYESRLEYKFTQYPDFYESNHELFSIANKIDMETKSDVMGTIKVSKNVKTKTVYFDKIEVADGKHSDIVFELNTVNKLLHDIIQMFGCDNKFTQLPQEIQQKFVSNKYIAQQIMLKEVKFQDFTIQVPANGFQTPFTLPNTMLENNRFEQLKELEFKGGKKDINEIQAIVPTQYSMDNIMSRSDYLLVMSCLKKQSKDKKQPFNKFFNANDRKKLFEETLDNMLKDQSTLQDGYNLLMYNTWVEIEKYESVYLKTFDELQKKMEWFLQCYLSGIILTKQDMALTNFEDGWVQQKFSSSNIKQEYVSGNGDITTLNNVKKEGDAIIKMIKQSLGIVDQKQSFTTFSIILKEAIQRGIVDPKQFNVGKEQIDLIILAQLLQKINNDSNFVEFVGDGEPLYILNVDKIEPLIQQYKTIQTKDTQISVIYNTLKSLLPQFKKDDKLGEVINKYIKIYNQQEIISYFYKFYQQAEALPFPTNLNNVASTQFFEPLKITGVGGGNLTADQIKQIIPLVNDIIVDYNSMVCALALKNIINYQHQRSYVTSDSLICLDILGNYINKLNSRTALSPLLQGQRLSHFVELHANNKLKIDVEQLYYTIARFKGNGSAVDSEEITAIKQASRQVFEPRQTEIINQLCDELSYQLCKFIYNSPQHKQVTTIFGNFGTRVLLLYYQTFVQAQRQKFNDLLLKKENTTFKTISQQLQNIKNAGSSVFNNIAYLLSGLSDSKIKAIIPQVIQQMIDSAEGTKVVQHYDKIIQQIQNGMQSASNIGQQLIVQHADFLPQYTVDNNITLYEQLHDIYMIGIQRRIPIIADELYPLINDGVNANEKEPYLAALTRTLDIQQLRSLPGYQLPLSRLVYHMQNAELEAIVTDIKEDQILGLVQSLTEDQNKNFIVDILSDGKRQVLFYNLNEDQAKELMKVIASKKALRNAMHGSAVDANLIDATILNFDKRQDFENIIGDGANCLSLVRATQSANINTIINGLSIKYLKQLVNSLSMDQMKSIIQTNTLIAAVAKIAKTTPAVVGVAQQPQLSTDMLRALLIGVKLGDITAPGAIVAAVASTGTALTNLQVKTYIQPHLNQNINEANGVNVLSTSFDAMLATINVMANRTGTLIRKYELYNQLVQFVRMQNVDAAAFKTYRNTITGLIYASLAEAVTVAGGIRAQLVASAGVAAGDQVENDAIAEIIRIINAGIINANAYLQPIFLNCLTDSNIQQVLRESSQMIRAAVAAAAAGAAAAARTAALTQAIDKIKLFIQNLFDDIFNVEIVKNLRMQIHSINHNTDEISKYVAKQMSKMHQNSINEKQYQIIIQYTNQLTTRYCLTRMHFPNIAATAEFQDTRGRVFNDSVINRVILLQAILQKSDQVHEKINIAKKFGMLGIITIVLSSPLETDLQGGRRNYEKPRQAKNIGTEIDANFNGTEMACIVFTNQKESKYFHSVYNGDKEDDKHNEASIVVQKNLEQYIPQYNQMVQFQGGLKGGMKSSDVYKSINTWFPQLPDVDRPALIVIDFQQGLQYHEVGEVKITLPGLFINIPPLENGILGSLQFKQNMDRAQKLFNETQRMLYIFNERKHSIEKFDPQTTVDSELYKGKLISLSNACALNNINNIQYTNLEKQTITQQMYDSEILSRIQNILQYYSMSPESTSILRTLENIVLDFVKENYTLLQNDSDYLHQYVEYLRSYNDRFRDPKEMFKFSTITRKDTNDRFAFWMGLEADYYINAGDKQKSVINDKHIHFKQLWFQLRKLEKIVKIPYQRAKLFFTRYTDKNNRYIGHDHYFYDPDNNGNQNTIAQMKDIKIFKYVDGVVIDQTTPQDEIKEQRQKHNMVQLFKLQTPDIKNISEQMYQVVYYQNLGLATDYLKSDYLDIKLRKLVTSKNIKLKQIKDGTDMTIDKDNMPFKLDNLGYGQYQDIFNYTTTASIKSIHFIDKQTPQHIFLHNSLYDYACDLQQQNPANKKLINPLDLSVHLQINSGISEPEITRSAITFGISVMPINTEDNDDQYKIIKDYFTQLQSCIQGLVKQFDNDDNKVQLSKIFKIIGVNPINAISLIKNNISFPIINIMSLFLRTYMRQQLKNINIDTLGEQQKIIKDYIEESNYLEIEKSRIKRFIQKPVQNLHPSRYLLHMMANSALFYEKMKSKRLELNQQYQLQDYKITLDSVQELDM